MKKRKKGIFGAPANWGWGCGTWALVGRTWYEIHTVGSGDDGGGGAGGVWGGEAEHLVVDWGGFGAGAFLLWDGAGLDAEFGSAGEGGGEVYAGVYDGAGLFGESERVYDGDVPDLDRGAESSVASG
jgi:hypothetical protein